MNRPQVPEHWKNVAVLGDVTMPPWKVGATFAQKAFAKSGYGRVRAALVAADNLQIALGRPNREQVVTVRSPTATTLQALELTNGSELAGPPRARGSRDGGRGIQQAGRGPGRKALRESTGPETDAAEMRAAREILGQPAQKAGVEDLMWALAMLPEFQLIY
jgi:hypothetical protein